MLRIHSASSNKYILHYASKLKSSQRNHKGQSVSFHSASSSVHTQPTEFNLMKGVSDALSGLKDRSFIGGETSFIVDTLEALIKELQPCAKDSNYVNSIIQPIVDVIDKAKKTSTITEDVLDALSEAKEKSDELI